MTPAQLLQKLNLKNVTDKFWTGGSSTTGLSQNAKIGHIRLLLEAMVDLGGGETYSPGYKETSLVFRCESEGNFTVTDWGGNPANHPITAEAAFWYGAILKNELNLAWSDISFIADGAQYSAEILGTVDLDPKKTIIIGENITNNGVAFADAVVGFWDFNDNKWVIGIAKNIAILDGRGIYYLNIKQYD